MCAVANIYKCGRHTHTERFNRFALTDLIGRRSHTQTNNYFYRISYTLVFIHRKVKTMENF